MCGRNIKGVNDTFWRRVRSSRNTTQFLLMTSVETYRLADVLFQRNRYFIFEPKRTILCFKNLLIYHSNHYFTSPKTSYQKELQIFYSTNETKHLCFIASQNRESNYFFSEVMRRLIFRWILRQSYLIKCQISSINIDSWRLRHLDVPKYIICSNLCLMIIYLRYEICNIKMTKQWCYGFTGVNIFICLITSLNIYML